jgi:hypothetical protein
LAWKRKSPIKREDGTKTQSGNPVFRTTYSLSRSTGCRAECDSGSKETADSVAAISAKCQLSIAAFNLLNIIEDHFIQETTENLEELEKLITICPQMPRLPEGLESIAVTALTVYRTLQAHLAAFKSRRMEMIAEMESEQRLQHQIQKAVEAEDYELAAELNKQRQREE